jgi:hypothetical protein
MKSLIKQWLGRLVRQELARRGYRVVRSGAGEPHWTTKTSKSDFRSGLGDSAWLLYGICRSLKPAVAVENGSARGKSACYIGRALKENGSGRLFAVDPHRSTDWNDTDSVDTYQVLRHHLEELGVAEVVTILPQVSDPDPRWRRPDMGFLGLWRTSDNRVIRCSIAYPVFLSCNRRVAEFG